MSYNFQKEVQKSNFLVLRLKNFYFSCVSEGNLSSSKNKKTTLKKFLFSKKKKKKNKKKKKKKNSCISDISQNNSPHIPG